MRSPLGERKHDFSGISCDAGGLGEIRQAQFSSVVSGGAPGDILTFDTFAALGCSEPFLSALAKRGFTAPTLVQAESFQPGLEGKDLLVQSRTGSGKTLAFGLPLMHRLSEDKRPQAIVLTPTRELAQQVGEELQSVMPRLEIA